MKRKVQWIAFVIGLSYLLIGCQQEKPVTSDNHTPGQLAYGLTYPVDEVLISGHRGISYDIVWPENCLESFDYLRQQVDLIIECDIAMTSDSVLVLMHDNTIDRTTTGSGNIANQLYSSIDTLHLVLPTGVPTDFEIPTFDEVLDWAKESQTILSVDIKRSVPVERVLDHIRLKNAEANCFIIAYTTVQSQRIYAYAPEFMQSISIRSMDEYERWTSSGVPADRTIAFMGTRQPNMELIKKLHQKGIAGIFGTLGNIDQQAVAKGNQVYAPIIRAEVDIMATDRPIAVHNYLNTLTK